jgi:hypothetical protein
VASSIWSDAGGAMHLARIAHESGRWHRVTPVNMHRVAKGTAQAARCRERPRSANPTSHCAQCAYAAGLNGVSVARATSRVL